jgi:molecular chaperone DnaJ
LKITEARKLLGVGPHDSASTIKKAFRQLAMRWHPDRNSAPEAGEKFARFATAYNLLLEQISDDGNEADVAPDRGADRIQELELDLETVCRGGKVEVDVETRSECEACSGRGYRETTFSQLCTACHGSGRVRRKHGLTNCPVCDGRGYTHRLPCPECDGKGKRSTNRVFTVVVPAGMFSGDELRLEGEGHPAASPSGQAGDLRLRVILRPHPLFGIEETDIVIDRPVSAFILLAGGTVSVPTPTGLLSVDIPPGPAILRETFIAGAGIPARGDRAAGALKVRFLPSLPTVSSPALVKHYRLLQKEIDRTLRQCCPELDAWEQQWLSRH